MTVIAALGPTNTGKTFYAIERLAAHKSGMIGLPLRLLTREVYDKMVLKVGPSRVAMITGEERIIPDNPKYWVCTVESMPMDKPVEFLAVDEIQLIDDPERGHIFTDRILNARGMSETLFMGSSISKKVIKKLINDVKFYDRERFSKLTYTGYKKISHLPKRSAVVAFSIQSVYAIAEIIKRQKGGVAVVMGSLSPQARNAQVKMYQNGDVDYIVATDAIGMGLNLDLNHIAFAETEKYDGENFRKLYPHELAQIAGRAGRYQRDGTFGVTGQANEIDHEVIARIEDHRFIPLNSAKWRNKNLNFSSVNKLIESLKAIPNKIELGISRQADDLRALIRLSQDKEIIENANNKKNIQTLWETSQIPDFRNISEGEHSKIISLIFKELCLNNKLSDEWLNSHIKSFDKYYGDINSLMMRLSGIRTWTYVSQKEKWLDNPVLWQKKTREIEDKLSDALHNSLTERFVEKTSSKLRIKYKDKKDILSGINDNGDVTVEGEYFGKIHGFKLIIEKSYSEQYLKQIRPAISKSIELEMKKKSLKILSSEFDTFTLNSDLFIYFNDEKIAGLKPGNNPLNPKISIICDEYLDSNIKKKIENKFLEWIQNYIKLNLREILSLENTDNLSPGAKGIAFRLLEELGLIRRNKIENEIKILDQKSRQELRKMGVKIGKFSIFFPATVKPKATELLISLWINYSEKNYNQNDIKLIRENLPKPGITSCALNQNISHEIYKVLGYLVIGKMVIRADIIERLDKIIYNEIDKDKKDKSFLVTDEMISLLGCSRENMKLIIKDLGFIKNNKKISKPNDIEVISEDPEIWYKKKYNYGVNIQRKSRKFKKKLKKDTASNFFAENNDLKKLKERLKFE
jgi:ATP-dependent RNA helicase SUPV3L1/SUV3